MCIFVFCCMYDLLFIISLELRRSVQSRGSVSASSSYSYSLVCLSLSEHSSCCSVVHFFNTTAFNYTLNTGLFLPLSCLNSCRGKFRVKRKLDLQLLRRRHRIMWKRSPIVVWILLILCSVFCSFVLFIEAYCSLSNEPYYRKHITVSQMRTIFSSC